MARVPRKERWLLRRADILALAGREAESKSAYDETLSALARLPERLRRLSGTRELEGQARAGLFRLAASASKSSTKEGPSGQLGIGVGKR